MVRWILAALLASGCVRSATTFECASADQCMRDGIQGRCEVVSVCSFPDPICASGMRFGDYAGGYANQCVGDDGELPDAAHAPDASVPDGSLPDSSMADAPSGSCPASYTALPGAGGTHLYRKVTTSAGWSSHMTACAIDGSNAYLAIPDNAAELAALVADADVWVGISDSTTEGTYQTVRGTIATFLPWGASEPDNNGNQDCVGGIEATGKLETLTCTTMRPALCECEP